MFPPADRDASGPDEPTVVGPMEDVVDEATLSGLAVQAPHNLRKPTLMGIGPLPPRDRASMPPSHPEPAPANGSAPGARESSQPDEPTLIKKVSELLEESLREAAPSIVDFTSPVLIHDARLDAPRRAAEPSAPHSTGRRATAGIREIVGALAIVTVAFTINGDRPRRQTKAPEHRPTLTTVVATAEATPSTPVPGPPETARQQSPSPSAISEPAATSEAATPDASPPVAARTVAPLAPTRASVLHGKLPVVTTTASALSKPKWLLKPAKVDNPY
jgi:hypothetical protein